MRADGVASLRHPVTPPPAPYQVVVGPDAEELPEVAEGHGGVGLEAEVGEVVSWGQVAALTDGGRECRTISGTSTQAAAILPALLQLV